MVIVLLLVVLLLLLHVDVNAFNDLLHVCLLYVLALPLRLMVLVLRGEN